MTQITLIIALLFSLALGNSAHSGVDTARKVEPPTQQAGGGEGGWPGF